MVFFNCHRDLVIRRETIPDLSKGLKMKKVKLAMVGFLMALLLSACAPEVGSPKWCDDMDDTNKGDWSTNDAKEYANNCVFRQRDDD